MVNINALFESFKVTDHAKTAQLEITDHLKRNGFDCILEFCISEYADGKTGRIDIIAIKGTERIAIEVDNRSPRKRSMQKLKNMSDYQALILLRSGNYDCEIEGIKVFSLSLKEE